MVIFPSLISSAARPPIAPAIRASRYGFVRYDLSSCSQRVNPPACPRAMIDILPMRSPSGMKYGTNACPASWYAVSLRSSAVITLLLRAGPIDTRSIDSKSSSNPIDFLFLRAAKSADSLIRLARSAPEKPGVCLAIDCISASLSNGLPFACTSNIAVRPRTSGLSIVTLRSNLPGRNSAGSKISGRLVAAMTMTDELVSKPSISTRIWFSVCSRSSCPPPKPAPRCLPTASISSTKMMHGECRFACWKRSLTLDAPTPTNISTNSDPDIEKKGTPASPATARANSVLPVPGGPTSRTPRGMRAPNAWKRSGNLRNSTISSSSSLASGTPATSKNVTVAFAPTNMRARVRPKLSV